MLGHSPISARGICGLWVTTTPLVLFFLPDTGEIGVVTVVHSQTGSIGLFAPLVQEPFGTLF